MLPDCRQEHFVWQHEKALAIALDEVGRGPLAGPVVACAFCIVKTGHVMPRSPIPVNDSKRLPAHQREKIADWIKTVPEFSFATCFISHKTIDRINIRQASLRAMRQAVQKLEKKLRAGRKKVLLIDGVDVIPGISYVQRAIVHGDARVFSISCASIIAKVSRDAHMLRMAEKYPAYEFEKHKGYGTKRHRALIKKHGLSPIHRVTFSAKFAK